METEVETGNRNWKQKREQKMHQSTGAIFSSQYYSSILLSNRYRTGFMSYGLPLLLYCAL